MDLLSILDGQVISNVKFSSFFVFAFNVPNYKFGPYNQMGHEN